MKNALRRVAGVVGRRALCGTLLLCPACADTVAADLENMPLPIESAALVAEADSGCPAEPGAAASLAAAAAAEADARWDRVPFDASEAVASIRRGRVARTCFEAAGLRDPRRNAAAQVLLHEQTQLRMLLQARRTFIHARSKAAWADARSAGELMVRLLDPDNPSTHALRSEVSTWLRGLQADGAGAKENP